LRCVGSIQPAKGYCGGNDLLYVTAVVRETIEAPTTYGTSWSQIPETGCRTS